MEEVLREQEQRRAAGTLDPGALFDRFTREHQAADDAVEAAIRAEASGIDPAAALRPILALEGRMPIMPRLMAEMQAVSPRTVAYAALIARWRGVESPEGPRPSRALALAAADAWKAELVALRPDPIIRVELAPLAGAYADLGELQAARGVADLDRGVGPLGRLSILTAARAWDEAADLAAQIDVRQVADAILRAMQAERQAERAARSPAEARFTALFPDLDRAPDPAEIEAMAAGWVAQAREDLLTAARASADPATARRIEQRLAPGA